MYLCLDSNNSLLTNGSGNVIRSKEKSDLNHIYPFIYTRKDMFFSASLKLQTKRYERPLESAAMDEKLEDGASLLSRIEVLEKVSNNESAWMTIDTKVHTLILRVLGLSRWVN
ncbi:uncharacterized protein LOC122198064 [Lactuca sativa]|uniref:uncharacterized protein LOC122198064 n=1 Tax=Lactuca sativa TaxID=4236 RepID=UPI001C691831|nr:uncharacterized protein LOC122198064 [Lactuca sativa]